MERLLKAGADAIQKRIKAKVEKELIENDRFDFKPKINYKSRQMVNDRRAFSITDGAKSPISDNMSSSKFRATNVSIDRTNLPSPEQNRNLSNSITAAYVVRTKDESVDICSGSKRSKFSADKSHRKGRNAGQNEGQALVKSSSQINTNKPSLLDMYRQKSPVAPKQINSGPVSPEQTEEFHSGGMSRTRSISVYDELWSDACVRHRKQEQYKTLVDKECTFRPELVT